MPTSAELGATLTTKRQEHGAFLAQYKKDDGYDMPTDKVGEFQTRNAELTKLQSEWETAVTVEKSALENDSKLGSQGRMVKDQAPTESKEEQSFEVRLKSGFKAHEPMLKAMADGAHGIVRFEVPAPETKTLVTTADHYPPYERARTTPSALFYNSVEDLFASGSTNANNVEYFIQSTDTDNTAAKAEGSAATDSAFVWTKVTDEVETMQTWIPVTREFLNDNAGMQSIIEGMLLDRLEKYVSKELMYGTGSTPQLWGVTVRTNFASQAKGTDPVFDTILKAADDVAVAGDATPDAVIMHPTDWMNLVLTRTTDGIYILGNPGNAPVNPSLWGIPVRVTTTVAAAAGTACVGAFRTMAQIYNNGGITVEASSEHSTYFTERKVALAVSRRLAAVNYRPTAFSKVTGL